MFLLRRWGQSTLHQSLCSQTSRAYLLWEWRTEAWQGLRAFKLLIFIVIWKQKGWDLNIPGNFTVRTVVSLKKKNTARIARAVSSSVVCAGTYGNMPFFFVSCRDLLCYCFLMLISMNFHVSLQEYKVTTHYWLKSFSPSSWTSNSPRFFTVLYSITIETWILVIWWKLEA